MSDHCCYGCSPAGDHDDHELGCSLHKSFSSSPDEYDLRVLWHAYCTDTRPPADLQARMLDRSDL